MKVKEKALNRENKTIEKKKSKNKKLETVKGSKNKRYLP
jgi:hypothetical protein